jgi:carbon monoxide dehydrogenase subunit G
MVQQDFTQQINAPVEKVFAFVSDFRNNSKWQTGVIESTQTPDGPTQVGTQVKDRRTFLGQKMEGTYEVTEYVPSKKLAFKSTSGPIQFRFAQDFESMGEGTKISVHVEMEAGGFFKPAEGALAGNLKKEFESEAATLKSLLEG